MKWLLTSLNAVFASQTNKLISLDYHKALELSADDFQESLQPLRNQLVRIADIDFPENHLPFVIVIVDEKIPLKQQLEIANQVWWEEDAYISCHPNELTPLVQLPHSNYYLAIDVECGDATKIHYPMLGSLTVNIHERSPLTINEGVALLTQKQDLVSFDRSLLLSGSRYCGHYHKNETPFITLYAGEFDYGFEINHTIGNSPFAVSRQEREKISWGTPTCQFRISAIDADYKTEILPLFLRDRIALENIAIYAENMSLSFPTLENIVHATLALFDKLMSWHRDEYDIVCDRGDYSMGGIYLRAMPHYEPGTTPGDRPIEITWSKKEQDILTTLVRDCHAQDYVVIIRYAIHVFYNVLKDLDWGRNYSIVKRGEETQKVDLLANLPR